MSQWFAEYKKTIFTTLIISTIIIIGVCLVYGFITGSIDKFFDNFMETASPIIIGFIIAYLSNPIVMFLEKKLFAWIPKFTAKRLVCIILTLIFIILVLSFIVTMLIPNILSTLASFWETYIVNYETSLTALVERINSIVADISFLKDPKPLEADKLIQWVQHTLPWIDDIVSGDFSAIFPSIPSDPNAPATPGINISDFLTSDSFIAVLDYILSLGTSVFNGIKNGIFGIFIAVYMLMSKERLSAYFKRMLNAFLPPRKVRSIIRFAKLLDRSFGGFIKGQLLDAMVVGIMSYFIFVIFNMPIPHLLATIIAVTNVIPILGPFLGGIPATILVLLSEPEKMIFFILLVIIIQQIDGNLLCPNILGDKINLSSLTTIVAIITMGGLFGIFGMLIGVPVFAVLLHILNNYTMNALRRKGLETSLKYYYVGSAERISDTENKVRIYKKNSFKNIYDNIKKLFSKKTTNTNSEEK